MDLKSAFVIIMISYAEDIVLCQLPIHYCFSQIVYLISLVE